MIKVNGILNPLNFLELVTKVHHNLAMITSQRRNQRNVQRFVLDTNKPSAPNLPAQLKNSSEPGEIVIWHQGVHLTILPLRKRLTESSKLLGQLLLRYRVGKIAHKYAPRLGNTLFLQQCFLLLLPSEIRTVQKRLVQVVTKAGSTLRQFVRKLSKDK